VLLYNGVIKHPVHAKEIGVLELEANMYWILTINPPQMSMINIVENVYGVM